VFTIDVDRHELDPRGPGLSVSFPMHSLTGASSSAAVLFELEPGAELPVHTDSAEELLLVLSGRGQARVGDEVGILETHQAALVPAMAPHGMRNIGSEPLRVLGTFSASTVVATFEEPQGPEDMQVVVIGAPVEIGLPLVEAVAA
jgi:quercetin dioxygenase-like cupin family protein